MSNRWGRETIRLVEVDQPRCALEYGESPCQAGLGVTGAHKCFKTFATCQDPASYDGSDVITMKFSWDQPELSRYYDYSMPMLMDIQTTPASVNIGAMDESSSAMGQREVVNIMTGDGQHSDLLFDTYRYERLTGEASLIHAGFVPSSSPPITYLDTLQLDSYAGTDDDEYRDKKLLLLSGPGSPQQRDILSYQGPEQIAKVERWGAPYHLELEDELPAYVFQAEDLGAGVASVDLIWGGYDLTMTFTRGGSDVATTIDQNGLMILVDPDSPRFFYHPDTLEPLGYLPESQSTNRCTNSENLSAGTWTPQHATVALTDEYAPDGTLSVYKLYEDAVAGVEHNIVSNDVAITANENLSASVFLKPLEREWFLLTFTRNSQLIRVWVNASTGSVGTVSVSGSGALVYDVKMRYFSKYGYYRVELFFVLGGGETTLSSYYSPVPGDGVVTFDGDGSSGGIIWGNQIERRRGVTSYMKTTGAEVTRNADTLDFSGFSIESEITTYLENYRWQGGDPNNGTFNAAAMSMDDGTGNNTLWMFQSSNNFLALQTNVSAALQINYGVSNVLAYGQHWYQSMARWKPGDHAGVVARDNVAGMVVANSNASALPSVNILRIGTHISAGAAIRADSPIRRVIIWNKALSDATMDAFVEDQSLSYDVDFPNAFPTEGTEYKVADVYDPNERGTFWGKWLARNPYHTAYPVRVYTGDLGEAQSEMTVRNYVVDRVEGPSQGMVKLVAKDQFTLIEQSKAVAPRASRGELSAGISDSDMSFTVIPSAILDEDYPIPAESPYHFYVAIGDEVIEVTRSGGTFTVITRGALNTEPASHDAEDLVQWVLSYEQEQPHEIAYQLLTDYSAVPPAWIDKAQWDIIAADITQLYTGRIATPTPVLDLLGELCQHARMTLWPDVSDGMIKLSALRPKSSKLKITDAEWVLEDSVEVRRRDERRVTQVWVYYGQKRPTGDLDDPKNYTSRIVVADLEAEELYSVPRIRTIYSRWIPQFGRPQAEDVAEGILQMFRDPPREVMLSAPASRAGELVLSDVVSVETDDVQDELGLPQEFQASVVEISGDEERIDYKLLETLFYLAEDDTQDRTIYIENDAQNLNMRSIFDTLYSMPDDSSPSPVVTFIILPDVSIGSASTSLYSLRTGTWPAYIDLRLINQGRVQGRGGNGGAGASAISASIPGSPGQSGGPAFLAENTVTVDNTDGEIWGGDGGGGGGAAIIAPYYAGGGGGGGAGTPPGSGGPGGVASGYPNHNGFPGSSGTPDTGGNGGSAGYEGTQSGGGGGGGAGPTPGVQGAQPTTQLNWVKPTNGSTTTGGNGGYNTVIHGAPAAGGSKGAAINGNSFIAWTGMGDIRGAVS